MKRTTLKDRILDFTEVRLWEQGYRGMRVDELARDVGISKRTLYEQFRTKEEMAHDALARRLLQLQGNIDSTLVATDDEAEQLREIVKHVSRVFANARPPFFRDLETTPSLIRLVETSHAESHAKIEAVIAAGAKNGRFKGEVEPRLVRRVLLGAVGAVVKPDSLDQDGRVPDQAFSATVDLILHGLLD